MKKAIELLKQYNLTETTPDGRIDFAVNQVLEKLSEEGKATIAERNALVMMTNKEVLELLKV